MRHTIFPHTEKIDFNKKLRIKFGIDPTSDKLHLGHLIPLLEVKKLWEQGHHVDIVLGTFTAQLGDPSGKDTMRPILDKEQTELNAKSIIEQIERIFDSPNESHPLFKNIEIHHNHHWFQHMNAIEMTSILSKFTTTQLLSRDSFQKRIENKNPIGMHELIVPLLQGFDSVKLKTDVEIGGTDQLFNFGITRDMQHAHGQAPEKCILMPIINGTDGRKMSKSFGNCIFINDTAEDVFGKVMSISDSLMKEWWPVLSDHDIPTDPKGDCLIHPMKLKKDLALFITVLIWGRENAFKAQKHFENVIQNKKMPDKIQGIISTNIIAAICMIRHCSISEAKRLIKQGAVRLNDVKVENESITISKGDIVKIGKLDLAKVE